MKTHKASAPRDFSAPHDTAVMQHSDEEIVQARSVNGMVTQTRRYVSPFVSLRDTGTLTPNQSAAAGKFMALYAAYRGIGGAPDRDGIVVDEDRSGRDYAYEALMRAKGHVWAANRMQTIHDRIGRTAYDVLTVLCQEFLEGDAMAAPKDETGKPQTRWRVAVKGYFRTQGRVLATPNEQNLAVWWACHELEGVMLAGRFKASNSSLDLIRKSPHSDHTDA